ncbi:biotin--[acetyl-CoA-carboxylase] ligase [Oceanivirga salmonicida]|uniref:biotin--[acetyl-CoA-carboxylase] ligase n=1 Tax=Oceanivirga salmonicida TaxID=1769291 RepID=UPI0009E781D7|nr:biotin--[acetyl-CoA-carboxylase] ligase [Oceanivirga salmonicida]
MNIFKFDVLESTNEYLKANNSKYDEFDIIIAENQSKGKARNGNNWVSDIGMGLFTFYINKNFKSDILMKIPIISGLAVIKALNKIEKSEYMFKWTNDIYLKNKKLCGILIENVDNKTYIGIGININNTIPNEIENIAISMNGAFGKKYNIDEIIKTIVCSFKELLNMLLDNKFDEIIKEVNKVNYLKNKKIVFKISEKLIKAKILDINKDGFIEAIVNNEKKVFSIGEIIREKRILNLDLDNSFEIVKKLQEDYVDIIAYSVNNYERAKIIAKKAKIKLYKIENKEDLENLKRQYNCNEYDLEK